MLFGYKNYFRKSGFPQLTDLPRFWDIYQNIVLGSIIISAPYHYQNSLLPHSSQDSCSLGQPPKHLINPQVQQVYFGRTHVGQVLGPVLINMKFFSLFQDISLQMRAQQYVILWTYIDLSSRTSTSDRKWEKSFGSIFVTVFMKIPAWTWLFFSHQGK